METLQRFNTPGKLKNFKETVDVINEHEENLQEWRNFKQLSDVVSALSGDTQYLSQAQLVLDENDPWQNEVKSAAQELRNGIEDKAVRLETSFKQSQLSKFEALKKHIRVAIFLFTKLPA